EQLVQIEGLEALLDLVIGDAQDKMALAKKVSQALPDLHEITFAALLHQLSIEGAPRSGDNTPTAEVTAQPTEISAPVDGTPTPADAIDGAAIEIPAPRSREPEILPVVEPTPDADPGRVVVEAPHASEPRS